MTELEGGALVALLGAVGGALAGSITRRRDEKDRRTGERIGVLEEREAYERGRQAGLREACDGCCPRCRGKL